MIIMGLDPNGVARPVRVNANGEIIIAGETINGNFPTFRLDEDGHIILSTEAEMAGFLMVAEHPTLLSPADSLTYYVGRSQGAPVVTAQRARMRVLQTSRLTKMVAEINVAGVLGTAENCQLNVRVNDTTNNAVFTTIQLTAIQQAYISAALAINFTAGDFFESQFICPAWVTNPTNVSFVVYYWFDLV